MFRDNISITSILPSEGPILALLDPKKQLHMSKFKTLQSQDRF